MVVILLLVLLVELVVLLEHGSSNDDCSCCWQAGKNNLRLDGFESISVLENHELDPKA